MRKTEMCVWDPADHLITGEDMAAYLEAALQEGDSTLIAAALRDIARARNSSDTPETPTKIEYLCVVGGEGGIRTHGTGKPYA